MGGRVRGSQPGQWLSLLSSHLCSGLIQAIMTTNDSSSKRNLIKCIERIGTMATCFHGDPERFDLKDPDIMTLSEFLEVPPLQTVIFSVVFVLNFKNRSVDVGDMARYMETSNLNVLPLLTELEPLESKRLIRRYTGDSRVRELRRTSIHEIGYYITRNVLEGIVRNDKSYLKRKEKHTMVSLLNEIDSMVDERDDGNMTFEELVAETSKLLQHNTELAFVKRILMYDLSMQDLLMLLYICQQTISGIDGVDLARACDKIYDDADTRFQVRRTIFKGRNDLMQKNLLKLREGFFKTDREVLLTEQAVDDLFGQDKDFIMAQDKNQRELLGFENIRETKLFFNPEVQSQLDFVTGLLEESRYKAVLQRMEALNMPQGVAILFHGSPGTGKTASAFEIARRTGRDLFMVDISRTKSMWFGESEKIIKDLFDRYGRLVKNSDKTPILLFNEADAVLSSRKENNRSSVDQTENTIQNIILQEMEKLNGIMIATTNLTQNLDNAFERRFLFKIFFNMPNLETMHRILTDKLHMLKPHESEQIASQFNLSGGNIENIARKAEIYKVLHGDYPEFEKLIVFCREESINGQGRRVIGF